MELTTGQAERFQTWLLQMVDEAEREAKKSPEEGKWHGYYRGRAAAFQEAEQALGVASVGALPLRTSEPTR